MVQSAPATTVDHVVPKSKGGAFVWTNLVASCGPCNMRKGNRLLENTTMTLLRQPRTPTMHEVVQWRTVSTTNLQRRMRRTDDVGASAATWHRCAAAE